ncbi:MAG TPA: GNAT family N-acetyltransferase [Acidimicrobiales bacterium]|nr:GNAT family N-acetyltransferase [Acidimicrobiales bacterium]
MGVIGLRMVEDDDLDALFEQMRDPDSVHVAAFTAADPSDRGAFDAHVARVRAAEESLLRAVTCDDQLVGSIATYVADGRTEVTYWIDRWHWGHGIATRALALLLEEVSVRPLHARAASDNTRSLRVLKRNGFRPVGTERSFAPARRTVIEETILRLR